MEKGISGIVEYTILTKDYGDKEHIIMLLGDIHDHVNYCTKNQHLMYIDEFLESLIGKYNYDLKYNIFLEEVPRINNIHLEALWPDSIHTNKLTEFYLKHKEDVIALDIRPFLVPFSHYKYFKDKEKLEKLKDEDELKKTELKKEIDEYTDIKMSEYLETLDVLFCLKIESNREKFKNSKNEFFINILKALEGKVKIEGVCKLYTELKKEYNDLKNEIKNEECNSETVKDCTLGTSKNCISKTFKELINEESKSLWFKRLNELKIKIMDWYTVIQLLKEGFNICHFGLYHYNNCKKILIEDFGFKCTQESKKINIYNNIYSNIDACFKFK